MRTMHSVDFCDACIEGLWQSLLRPLTLIDEVTTSVQEDGRKIVTLDLLPLAEFRQVPRDTVESFSVHWYIPDGETLIEGVTNETSIIVAKCVTSLEVEVTFHSEQVRVDTGGVMVDRQTISLE